MVDSHRILEPVMLGMAAQFHSGHRVLAESGSLTLCNTVGVANPADGGVELLQESAASATAAREPSEACRRAAACEATEDVAHEHGLALDRSSNFLL
jgi:hypothetical protein